MDGATVERLSSSVFLGGDGDEVGKREVPKGYVASLSKWRKRHLTDSQKKTPRALRLAVAPKSEQESRVVTTSGAHSKIVFSVFCS